MKAVAAFASFSAALLAASSVNAIEFDKSKFYVGASAGVSVMQDYDVTAHEDTDSTLHDYFSAETGYNLGINVGYRIDERFRLQADLGYLNNSNDTMLDGSALGGDLSMMYATASVYHDIPVEFAFQPFVGLGLGVSRMELDLIMHGAPDPDAETIWLFKAAAGASYDLTDKITVVGEYSYLRSSDYTVFPGDNMSAKLTTVVNTHTFNVGLRYNF